MIDSCMRNACKQFLRSSAISNRVSEQGFERCNKFQYEAWYNQNIIEHSPNLNQIIIKLRAVKRGNIIYVDVSQLWELNMCDVRLAGLLMIKRPRCVISYYYWML